MEEQLQNDRQIAYHRNKEDYEPQPENALQFAYGDSRYDKMTRQLLLSDDILKLKTLEEINEDFHRADLVTLALLSSDLLTILIKHIENPHDRIRELASKSVVCKLDQIICQELVSQVSLGKDQIMENCYIRNIMKLFDDGIVEIRRNAYYTLLNVTEFQVGIDHALDLRAFEPLISKLVEESVESILIEVLNLMQKLLSGEQGQVEVLRTPAIKRLTGLLYRNNSQIRRVAMMNLCAISFSEKGKIEVINQGCVADVCHLMGDEDDCVIEAATMTLASLAQRNEAKFQVQCEYGYVYNQQMMDCNQLPKVIELLSHGNNQIKLNTVQLIASLAEHPVGRQQCKQCLETLKVYTVEQEYEYIGPYANQAMEIILWKP